MGLNVDTPSQKAPMLPTLPEFVVDRFGLVVDTSNPERWLIMRAPRPWPINWSHFAGVLSGVALHAFKLYLCHCIESLSPEETYNVACEVRGVIAAAGRRIDRLEDLDLAFFGAVRQRLRETRREYRLHRLRAWCLWMADAGLAGMDLDLAERIKRWRIPGNPKGEAVMSQDPDKGPLSDAEFELMVRAVQAAPPEDLNLGRTVALLCIELGSNPRNLTFLEERDFHEFKDPRSGAPLFQLDVP